MDQESDRRTEQQKNVSTAAGTQPSRGDGPAAESTRRGAKSNSEESAEDDDEESGSEECEDEESAESDPSDDDPEKQRFMRRPPAATDYNADGTLKFQAKSKLLLKIDQLGDALDAEEDDVENSFGEEFSDDEESEEDEEDPEDERSEESPSHPREHEDDGLGGEDDRNDGNDDQEEKSDGEGSAGDGDEDEEEDEDEEDSPAPKREAKQKQQAAKKREEPPPKRKRLRRTVVNVYCTEYDVVPRSAKKCFNCRLRYYEEDHDGALNDYGEGGQKLSTEWDLSWHDLSISADFLAKMAPYQKVNQYPGIYVLSRKHNLARNLMKMQRSFPEEYDFFPKTWIIPQENSDFRKQFHDRDGKPLKKKKTYIVKPDGLSQGQGIYLSRNCERIIKQCTNDGGYVVQEYLDKPHLVDELKYDLRIYVLVYGLNPLRVYIHEQGIARFATEPYVAPRASNIDNLYMHLTNYAINKNNSAFVQNQGGGGFESEAEDEESEEESGHKRSLHAIMKILMQQGADPDLIMDRIKDIIVKTVIVGQPYMAHIYRSCQPDDYDNSMCFQILGFDIMIDKHFRPWLIEVNQSPSFATDSALDYEVKKSVIQDAFKLLNLNQERRDEMVAEKQKQTAERILTGKQEKLDPAKKQEMKEERLRKRFEYENSQLRCGSGNNYELLFPSFFEEERNQKYEMLLKRANDNWDEFTCGAKGRRKAQEMEEQNKKAELAAKKLQRSKEKKFQNRAQKKNQQRQSQKQVDTTKLEEQARKAQQEKLAPLLNQVLKLPAKQQQEAKRTQGDKEQIVDSVAPIQNEILGSTKQPRNQKVVTGSYVVEQPLLTTGGRQSQQSHHQQKDPVVNPAVNNSHPRNFRQQQMIQMHQKYSEPAHQVVDSATASKYAHVAHDSWSPQVMGNTKQQKVTLIAAANKGHPGLDKVSVDALNQKNQSNGIDMRILEQRKPNKHASSEVKNTAKPTIELHSRDFVSAAHVGPASVQQMFQVSKKSNPSNRMSQIHENIQQLNKLSAQLKKDHSPLQSKDKVISVNQTVHTTPMSRTQTNFRIKNQPYYAGQIKAGPGGVSDHNIDIQALSQQRQLQDGLEHTSKYVTSNAQSENLIPSGTASKSLAHPTNLASSTQPPSCQQLATSLPTKPSPPGLSDSEAMRSFASQSYNRNHQQPAQVNSNILYQKAKSHGHKENRQLVMSHQDHDMAKLKTTNTNTDDTASALTHHHHLQLPGQEAAQVHGSGQNETPKQYHLAGLKQPPSHGLQNKHLISAQSYSHKQGQPNMFSAQQIDKINQTAVNNRSGGGTISYNDQFNVKVTGNNGSVYTQPPTGPHKLSPQYLMKRQSNGMQPLFDSSGKASKVNQVLDQPVNGSSVPFIQHGNGNYQQRVSANLIRQKGNGYTATKEGYHNQIQQIGVQNIEFAHQQQESIRNGMPKNTQNNLTKPIFVNQQGLTKEPLVPLVSNYSFGQPTIAKSTGANGKPLATSGQNFYIQHQASSMDDNLLKNSNSNYGQMSAHLNKPLHQQQQMPISSVPNQKRQIIYSQQTINMHIGNQYLNNQKLINNKVVLSGNGNIQPQRLDGNNFEQMKAIGSQAGTKSVHQRQNHLSLKKGGQAGTGADTDAVGDKFAVNSQKTLNNMMHQQKQQSQVSLDGQRQQQAYKMVQNPKHIEGTSMFFVPQGSNFNPNRRTCAGRKIV